MRVLITGANRGIGLELTRQYLARGASVEATARRPDDARALRDLATSGDLRVHALDVTDDASAAALARALGDVGLDLLVSNAGVYGDRDDLAALDLAEVASVIQTNAVGTLRVAAALLPALRRGATRKIAGITSGMGSIGDNRSGGAYGYRMSKAALNMALKTLAIDLAPERFTVVAVNPGWVKTDMGGPSAPTPVAESAANMIALFDRITPTDSGSFLDHRGHAWPW